MSIIDITERKRAEEALRESEEKFRSITEHTSDLIAITDGNGFITYASPASKNLLQIAPEEMCGHHFTEFFDEPSVPIAIAVFRDAVECGKMIKDLELTMKRQDGSIFVGAIQGWIYRCDEKNGILLIIRDITERKKVEDALRKSEERLRLAFEVSHMGLWDWNIETNEVHHDQGWADITGYSLEESQEPKIYQKIVHPDDIGKNDENITALLEGVLPSYESEYRLRTKLGDYTWVQARGEITERDNEGRSKRLSGIIIDITERKLLDEERVKTSKLESIALLARGIAHDFNNLLAVIIGNISLAVSYKDKKPEKVAMLLSEAEKAAIMASKLTEQFNIFSNEGAIVKKALNLGEQIRDSVDFALKGSNADSEIHIADDLWKVKFDPAQLHQVIFNLAVNAAQAMSESGIITVLAENVLPGSKESSLLGDGNYIKITVKDQGIGIPKENLSKIFDPYFTTRDEPTKKGSGLGLTSAYSIVKQHGGKIEVETESGRGSSFFVYLPAVSDVGWRKLKRRRI